MNILLFGVAGFVGSHLATRLLNDGHTVVGVDDFSTGKPDNVPSGVTFHLGDVGDWRKYDPSTRIDTVFHLASPASPRAYTRMPVKTLRAGAAGTENAAHIALTHGARLVYASSSEVYGDPAVSPQPETYNGNVSPTGPRSMYDESKRFGEAMCMALNQQDGLNVGIARIFNTYGPRMAHNDGRVIPAFFDAAFRGVPLPIFGDGTQTRSFCFVDDTVNALIALAGSGYIGPVNIGNPHEVSILDLARRVLQIVDVNPGLDFRPLPGDDPKRRCPDISQARALLNWEPEMLLQDGLIETAPWFAETRTPV